MSTTGALKSIRQANIRTIIEALNAHGELSRAELCQQTGLSRTTMQRILRDLLEQEVVKERTSAVHRSRGRPESLLAANADAGIAVGIELGRSQIAVEVLNYAGASVWAVEERLEEPLSWRDSMSALFELLDGMNEALPEWGRHLRLGLLGTHGLMPSSVNYPGSEERDRRIAELRSALKARLGVPVGIASNTRFAAMAEFRNRGLSEENLVYCHLSRGIGAAVIVGGQVLPGSTNSAGEFGHMRLVEDGLACHCGGSGCVETVVGLDAVTRRARQILPEISDYAQLQTATASDTRLQQMAAETATALGHAIGNMCNVMNPQYVVLGGELVALLPDWVDRVSAGVEETALMQVHEGLQVSRSTHGRRAASLGAGLTALDVLLGRATDLEGMRTDDLLPI